MQTKADCDAKTHTQKSKQLNTYFSLWRMQKLIFLKMKLILILSPVSMFHLKYQSDYNFKILKQPEILHIPPQNY